jgi:hypothetical protein
MKKVVCILMLSLFGCASIVSKSKYPVTFDSDPPKAEVSVKDENGVSVFQGLTPTTVSLRSGESYFDSKQYTATFTKDGYDPQTSSITSSLNGWYWGNLLVGGVIGMLIIDPITGAMYELDQPMVMASLKERPALMTMNTTPLEKEPQPVVIANSTELGSLEDKLSRLNALKTQGIISQNDYDAKKKKLIMEF